MAAAFIQRGPCSPGEHHKTSEYSLPFLYLLFFFMSLPGQTFDPRVSISVPHKGLLAQDTFRARQFQTRHPRIPEADG